jgi:hypothetical protein
MRQRIEIIRSFKYLSKGSRYDVVGEDKSVLYFKDQFKVKHFIPKVDEGIIFKYVRGYGREL